MTSTSNTSSVSSREGRLYDQAKRTIAVFGVQKSKHDGSTSHSFARTVCGSTNVSLTDESNRSRATFHTAGIRARPLIKRIII